MRVGGYSAVTRGLRELRKLKRECEEAGKPVPPSITNEIADCLAVLRGELSIQELQHEVERR